MTKRIRPSKQPAEPLPATAGLVVCESTGGWGAAWRRELTAGVPIVETRHLDAAVAELERFPHGVFAFELREQVAPQLIALLARLQTHRPDVLCVAHVVTGLRHWEMLLREAGAKMVLRRPLEVVSAAAAVEMHLARAPQPPLTMRERVWRRLPWSAAAVSVY